MKTAVILAGLAFLCILLVACAPGSNELINSENREGQVAGFWLGLWHGLIAPITFIISLFSKSVQMYEVHNNGGWYNFGFLLGVMILFGSGSGGAAARRHRQ